MAAPTRAQLRTRVEHLLDDIPSMALLTGTEEKIAASTLPAAQVGKTTARYRRQAEGIQLVTVNVPFFVVVAHIARIELYDDIQAALEAGEGWQDTIADYFIARPLLQRSDNGLAAGLGEIEFTEPDTTPFKESASGLMVAFSGILPVIIRRYSKA